MILVLVYTNNIKIMFLLIMFNGFIVRFAGGFLLNFLLPKKRSICGYKKGGFWPPFSPIHPDTNYLAVFFAGFSSFFSGLVLAPLPQPQFPAIPVSSFFNLYFSQGNPP